MLTDDEDLIGAVQGGIARADGGGESDPVAEKEKAEVKKILEEYNTARVFDKDARGQYNKDRRYAQGTADRSWASDANIIGAFIEILCSFLYAQDPDVSVRPAPRVGGTPDKMMDSFAKTLQIVISRLWKDAKIKKQMRKTVRSALSVGVGWVKVLMYTDKRRNPQLEKQLKDAQDNLATITQLQNDLGDMEGTPEERDAKVTELERQIAGMEARVEKLVHRGLCIDFVRAEDMQVSLDVADLADHCDANWNSNDLYIPKNELAARFINADTGKSSITAEDLKKVTTYYQRQTGANDKLNEDPIDRAAAFTEGIFVKATDGGGLGPSVGQVIEGSDSKPVEFVKIVELWDRRDNLIKTFVEGIQHWATEPYPPPQASTRFYPYFRLAFYDVDGARHAQSLSWRLSKLQDEYSATRSNGRLVRERSIPGTVFHKGQLDPEDVEKIQNSTHLEMIGVNPTNNDLPLDKIMAAKVVPRVDPLLYDTTPVLRDMQVLSGVQEAQAQQTSGPSTATEAEIQNSGFASRTGADRDMLEDLLTEVAQYTAQISIQSLTVQDVQRIAGMAAFWPGDDDLTGLPAMDVEDVLTLIEVEIAAGTTGKPQASADKETWATLLPMVERFIQQIQVAELTNPPLAEGYRNLMNETLHRLDDRLSIDSILPRTSIAPPPATPGAPGAAPPGLGDEIAPPVGNGTINNPDSQIPLPPTA